MEGYTKCSGVQYDHDKDMPTETTISDHKETTIPDHKETMIPDRKETTVPCHKETTIPDRKETTVPNYQDTSTTVQDHSVAGQDKDDNFTNESELRILPLLQQQRRQVVIGPLLLDKYVYGECHRMAPESGAPVFSDQQYVEYNLGGAGNVANNALALGLDVDMLTVVGSKDGKVLQLLNERGIGTDGVVLCDNYTVSRKIRFITKGRHLMRLDKDNAYELTEDDHRRLLQAFKQMLQKHVYHVVTISDYRNGLLTNNLVREILALTNERGIPTIVDPAKTGAYDKYIGCTYIKPNLHEAEGFCNKEIRSIDSIRDACEILSKELNTKACFLTLAEKGIAVYSETDMTAGKFHLIENPCISSPPIDVCGAGDTALAAIAFGISNRLPLTIVSQFATICAADVIRKPGTAIVDMLNVIQEKCLNSKADLDALKRIIPKDKVVVLTTGCFDMFHVGHAESLRQAKELGDVLVVALNSDVSVKTNKGDARPIWNLQQRIGVLLATKYVDFIVVFDERKPTWVVETLDPDIFVKGDDYTESRLRSTFPMLKKVHITKTTKLSNSTFCSTSDTIKKLQML